jgi:hypothetical protein
LEVLGRKDRRANALLAIRASSSFDHLKMSSLVTTNDKEPVAAPPAKRLHDFLQPLHMDATITQRLAQDLCENFLKLAAHSDDQFLPTPISDSILSHPVDGTTTTSGP